MSNPVDNQKKSRNIDVPLFQRVPTSIPQQIPEDDLNKILTRLDRIEQGIHNLTGFQLINGVWR